MAFSNRLENTRHRLISSFKVWGYSFKENLLTGTSKEGTSRDIGSYEEAMKQLTDTIRERLAYLDKELGGN